MQPRFKAVRENGITFLFKYDTEFPELLHIYVRHLASIDDALDTYFDAPEHIWNEEHRRFESYTSTHGLYWFWLNEPEKVMVVTCFKL